MTRPGLQKRSCISIFCTVFRTEYFVFLLLCSATVLSSSSQNPPGLRWEMPTMANSHFKQPNGTVSNNDSRFSLSLFPNFNFLEKKLSSNLIFVAGGKSFCSRENPFPLLLVRFNLSLYIHISQFFSI